MKKKRLRKIYNFTKETYFWNKIVHKKFFLIYFNLFFITFLYYSCFISNIFGSTNIRIGNITIEGKVKDSSRELPNLEGLDVVLIKYVISENGEVKSKGPQKRVKTNKNGNFKFINVIPDLRAGFQIGTRFEDNLYNSQIFFLKEGDTSLEKNIIIPGISFEVEKLKISKVSIVLEAGLGKVFITEILEVSNRSRDRINTENNPFEYSIPKDIENFAILSKNFKNSIKHSIKENTLKIKNTFQTGNSQIVYQYTLPSIFGSIELRREFDHSLDIVGIFTPINILEIRSEMISYSGKQKFDQTTFLSWETKNSDSNQIILKISNIPQTYFKYFFVTIFLLFLFFWTILLFLRKKLKK